VANEDPRLVGRKKERELSQLSGQRRPETGRKKERKKEKRGDKEEPFPVVGLSNVTPVHILALTSSGHYL
jgi:hypothetical protein